MNETTDFGTPLDKVRVLEFPKICDPRGRASRESTIVLLAIAGSFTMRLTDGENERTVMLNRANRGVLIPPGVWDTMHDFTTGSVALALASHPYEEEDYIRDYDEFLEYTAKSR